MRVKTHGKNTTLTKIHNAEDAMEQFLRIQKQSSSSSQFTTPKVEKVEEKGLQDCGDVERSDSSDDSLPHLMIKMEPDPIDIKTNGGSTDNYLASPFSASSATGQFQASVGPGPSQRVSDHLQNPLLGQSRTGGCAGMLASENLKQFSLQSQLGVPSTCAFDQFQLSTHARQMGEFMEFVDQRQCRPSPTSVSSGSQITSLQLQAQPQDSPCFSSQQLSLCAENGSYRHLIPPNFPIPPNEWMCNREFQLSNVGMYLPPASSTLQQANPCGANVVDIRGTKFPQRLWGLLQNAAETHSIHWNPYGTGFVIDHEAFEKEILSTGYFKTIKITSFVRQLNLYGFRKVKKALSNEQQVYLRSKKKTNQGKLVMLREYRHEFFRRDSRHLLGKVVRKTNHSHRSAIFQDAATSSCQIQVVNNSGLLQVQRFPGGLPNVPICGSSNVVQSKPTKSNVDPCRQFQFQSSKPPESLTNPMRSDNIPHGTTAASTSLQPFEDGNSVPQQQEVNLNFGNHPTASDYLQRPGTSGTPLNGAVSSSQLQNSAAAFCQRRAEMPRSTDDVSKMVPELMGTLKGPFFGESPSSSIFHPPGKQSPSAVQFSSAVTLPQPDPQPSWGRESSAQLHQMNQHKPIQPLTFNGPFESIPNSPTYSSLLQSNINGRPFAQYLTPVQTKPLELTRSVRCGAIGPELWDKLDNIDFTRSAEEKQYPMDLTYPSRAHTAPAQSGYSSQQPPTPCPATEFPPQQDANQFSDALFSGTTCQGGSSDAGSTPNSDIVRHHSSANQPMFDYRWSPTSGSLQMARNSYDYANEVNPQRNDCTTGGDGGCGNTGGSIFDFKISKPGKVSQIHEWMDKNAILDEGMQPAVPLPVTSDGAQQEYSVHSEPFPMKADHSAGEDEIAIDLSDKTISSASTPSSMTTFYATDPLPDQRRSSQSANTSASFPVYQNQAGLSTSNEWAGFAKVECQQHKTSRVGMGRGDPDGAVDCGQVSWCIMPQYGRKC